MNRSDKILTKRDLAELQQPLSRDGYSNDYFNELYGKKNNPHIGTERDRARKGSKSIIVLGGPSQRKWYKCSKCGKEVGGYWDNEKKLCKECFFKNEHK